MRRAAKVDQTAKGLVTLARELGAYVVILNGVYDANLYWRGTLYAIDWKTPKKAELTTAQQKLVIDGFPLKFVSTEQQLRELLGVK
jgi:hypothetical protein